MPETSFEEVQGIDMWWVRLAVFVPAAVMLWIFVEQVGCRQPHGEHLASSWLIWLLTILLCVATPVLLLMLRLTVTVDDAGVHVRYYPFVNRMIPFSEIHAFRARQYRPIREFGGWGIRGGLGKKMAYNARGNLGVELYLKNMKSVMIGSQKHLALAEALRKRGVAEKADG